MGRDTLEGVLDRDEARAHGLTRDPFKALVGPRPIGWITSLGADGVCNLAPYSFFNAVSDRPHYVMFSSDGLKHSLRNIHETGEFTCSMATWKTRYEMSVTSASVPADADEYQIAGLTAVASRFVKPPRVKEAPAALECKHWKTIELPDVEAGSDNGHFVVFGRVVGIYIDDDYVREGYVDTGAMRPIARLGYMQYSVVTPETVFDINRPTVAVDGSVTSPSS